MRSAAGHADQEAEMTSAVRRAPPGTSATRTEMMLCLIGGMWLLVGLFIDGYAHSEIIQGETEDFFTPWHGIFYSGFVFTAATIAAATGRRASRAPVRQWIPTGYGLAVAGIVVFALGGIGDGIRHTIFGIERKRMSMHC